MAGKSSKWANEGLSQEDFMIRDECILLDNDDNIIGHVNKKESHVFSPEQVSEMLRDPK